MRIDSSRPTGYGYPCADPGVCGPVPAIFQAHHLELTLGSYPSPPVTWGYPYCVATTETLPRVLPAVNTEVPSFLV